MMADILRIVKGTVLQHFEQFDLRKVSTTVAP